VGRLERIAGWASKGRIGRNGGKGVFHYSAIRPTHHSPLKIFDLRPKLGEPFTWPRRGHPKKTQKRGGARCGRLRWPGKAANTRVVFDPAQQKPADMPAATSSLGNDGSRAGPDVGR